MINIVLNRDIDELKDYTGTLKELKLIIESLIDDHGANSLISFYAGGFNPVQCSVNYVMSRGFRMPW